MNFHQLHIFYTVAEKGSFSAAPSITYDSTGSNDADSIIGGLFWHQVIASFHQKNRIIRGWPTFYIRNGV